MYQQKEKIIPSFGTSTKRTQCIRSRQISPNASKDSWSKTESRVQKDNSQLDCHLPPLTSLARPAQPVHSMARKLRLRYPGAIYHVMKGRGHREPVFANDRGRVEAGVEENVPLYGERRRGSLTMQEKRTKRCGGNLTISLTSW